MSLRLFRCMNSVVTFAPNNQPAPLGLTAQLSTSSGSDQTRSQNAPAEGKMISNFCTPVVSLVLYPGLFLFILVLYNKFTEKLQTSVVFELGSSK